MTGFLLTAKQKLMLCINKRLYRDNRVYRSYRDNRVYRSHRDNRVYRSYRDNRVYGGNRVYRGDRGAGEWSGCRRWLL